jgi:MFS superfamily sulfate permease-like transporter
VANVVIAFTGGYVSGASFNRSMTHERLGAKCALAIVLAGVFLLVAVAAAPSLIAWIPFPAMAAMLALTAVNMIEFRHARTRPFITICSMLVVACGVFIGIGSAVALAFGVGVAQHLAATAEQRRDS